ncbi:Osmotin, thaumatin-like protein [Pleurostoma richardsiae]|uniref:Osmotin, thaumatin-like protein n=1 Tax=Pleurostoma richardsiae TaxID=41990 RepID=A0AA38VYV0_9PEZI|nr:Osmotin, thaumatin-like protein [Pleurostoma richardsiae]
MASSNNTVPLVVTNNCPDTIWPGINTQSGSGPGTGGFELGAGLAKAMEVSHDWVGRVWGRTNCTFNSNGTGPANATASASCLTGDCSGKLDCDSSGTPPATLAEFTLSGGVNGDQNFYDISLVDGYNLPVGLVYLPGSNTTFIPPNLVNQACIGTAGYLADPARLGTTYTNSSFPLPLEPRRTNADLRRWCPWDLQAYPPPKKGGGVFPYPDDGIARPTFDPCLSACAKTGSDKDCCTGKHSTAGKCHAGLYARKAKRVCPDAYSYAFDDQTSTFIIPRGGGWRVVFCPEGRSTDILATFGTQLSELAASGALDAQALADVRNTTYIETHGASGAARSKVSLRRVVAAAVVVALAVIW